jgi:hypothetical protein
LKRLLPRGFLRELSFASLPFSFFCVPSALLSVEQNRSQGDHLTRHPEPKRESKPNPNPNPILTPYSIHPNRDLSPRLLASTPSRKQAPMERQTTQTMFQFTRRKRKLNEGCGTRCRRIYEKRQPPQLQPIVVVVVVAVAVAVAAVTVVEVGKVWAVWVARVEWCIPMQCNAWEGGQQQQQRQQERKEKLRTLTTIPPMS